MNLPPRMKANSFGYQISSPPKGMSGDISKIKVGASDKTCYSSKISSASKNSPPLQPQRLFRDSFNPEEEWEQDTTDTEIMKNINSLLDSGKLVSFLSGLDLYEPAENLQKISF